VRTRTKLPLIPPTKQADTKRKEENGLLPYLSHSGAKPTWPAAELMKENLCAILSGTPRGRYDEHNRKFSLGKKPRFIDQYKKKFSPEVL
jgi:hypothetical protein